MLSQPEVIEVEESVFPLLLYPDPGKPYRQRLGQYLKRIDAGTSNVNGSSPYMAARAGGLGRLDAMARAAVATGDRHRSPQLIAKVLQGIHKTFIYRALAGLTTGHLGEGEVGPAVCWPVACSIAHAALPQVVAVFFMSCTLATTNYFFSTKNHRSYLHK